MQVASTPV